MDLNDLKKIKESDTGHLAESLALLPQQIKNIWREAKKIKLSADFLEIDKIVIFGMGGSNLGARIIASVFKKDLKIPLIIEAGYEIPGYVNKKTLCILSSYSGNTEEVFSVFSAAKKEKAKLAAIGADLGNSRLREMAEKEKIPSLFFNASDNPSGQPRAGLGYSLFGLLFLLSKLKVLRISEDNVKEAEKIAAKTVEKFSSAAKNNQAKILARKFFGQGVIILGGDFLEGNLHTLRNQFNENGKNFSFYLVLPEMNHYALEGLSFPGGIKKELIFLIFNSEFYGKRIGRRLELTKKIIKKNKIKILEYSLMGKSKLEQAVEMLAFGGWLTFYLGILNNTDPSAIPWVDWFKKKM